MTPIDWDKCEMFTASNGMQFFKWAASDKLGVKFEMSQHDETIRRALPESVWVPVTSAPFVNAKVDYIERGFRVLIGYGVPSDPGGNLMLILLTSSEGFDKRRMAEMISRIAMMVAVGIRPDKSMMDVIRGN